MKVTRDGNLISMQTIAESDPALAEQLRQAGLEHRGSIDLDDPRLSDPDLARNLAQATGAATPQDGVIATLNFAKAFYAAIGITSAAALAIYAGAHLIAPGYVATHAVSDTVTIGALLLLSPTLLFQGTRDGIRSFVVHLVRGVSSDEQRKLENQLRV